LSSSGQNGHQPEPSSPPESWPAARRAAKRLLSPVESFLAIEASSGIILLVAAVVAVVWANSPWEPFYRSLLHTPIELRIGTLGIERDLHFWINDGLMVVFFFVVGLEIKRELHCGELSEVRRAALPAIAAFGGMVVPAAIYALVNAGTAGAPGWGVPMATDIAFAVGVLALLGKRVPPALRILLLALAVIDDLGAILVIAFFYSSGVSVAGLAVAGAGIVLILAMQKLGVRSPWAYVPAGLLTWAGAYASGVHPTLAGVVVGLLTPARAWFGPQAFADRTSAAAEAVRADDGAQHGHELHHRLAEVKVAHREAVSPAERIQHALHGWVAFGIMPLFALANAGVTLGSTPMGPNAGILVGVVLGLVLGKPIGVFGFSWLAVRAGLATLPTGIGWSAVLVVGLVAGIGFTMALFIASLAFPPGPLIEIAKLGVLCASVVAALGGVLAGKLALPAQVSPEAARTLVEAETSTPS
jgi:NhaA family Na+:H+ antiporter